MGLATPIAASAPPKSAFERLFLFSSLIVAQSSGMRGLTPIRHHSDEQGGRLRPLRRLHSENPVEP